jgi:predicted aldo/keto reductase-like oxidoreductase
MTTTKLSNLLTIINESNGAYSLQTLARDLDVTPERVESMLDFWVRKGMIRHSTVQNCVSCSANGNCPFAVEMPLVFELVREKKRE